MRNPCPALWSVLLLVVTLAAPAAATHETTVGDLIAMSQAGVRDVTVLLFVEQNDVCVPLSTDDAAASGW